MRLILAALALTMSALPVAGSSSPCQPGGVLKVVNDRLDATASKDGEAVVNSPVALYSHDKPVGKTKTDQVGHFAFDHLAPGKYDLVIAGLGSFSVEVNPNSTQQMSYGFWSHKGCLGWTANTN
jgi:hypothetical protein